MTLRKWTLGMAVAAAALLGLNGAAYAVTTPNLTGGVVGQPIQLQFDVFTAENPLTGGATFGNSCNSGATSCQETTFGAGFLTASVNLIDSSTPWTNGMGGQSIYFVIYGIADLGSTPGGSNGINLYNTGATSGNDTSSNPLAGYNGKINIDMYALGAGSVCFTASGCVGPDDRTSASQLTGLTVAADQIAHIELVPGAIDNGTATSITSVSGSTGNNAVSCPASDNDNSSAPGCVTLYQNVNALTDPANTTGTFYADCVSGTLCGEFEPDTQTANGYTADFAGVFTAGGITAATGNAINKVHPGSCIVFATFSVCNGWQEGVNSPGSVDSLSAVPEPASLAALGTGLALFGVAIGWRRRKVGSA